MSGMNKSKWIAAYENEREYFATDPHPFEKWDRRFSPEMKASWALQNGSEVLFGNAGHAVADKFLHATVDLIDRAIAEDRFRHPRVFERAFPGNRGRGLRTRAYAKGLLGGKSSEEDLIQASFDYQVEYESTPRGDWDSISQADVTSAARMALLAGNLSRAKEVLSIKRSMKWHAEEFKLLKDLTKEAELGLPIRDPWLLDRVRILFDRLRDPDYKPDYFIELELARLEWGALIAKYFETGGQIDWDRVIELVSE